jgi:hypothetical protein
MGHASASGRQRPTGLRPLHFELYRLMWACSAPANGGRPVCSYGQAKLAVRLGISVSTVGRLIADLREPGADVRHPKAEPRGRRLGWLLELPRAVAGGRGGTLYGGNRYVLQVDPAQVDQLEAFHLAPADPSDLGQVDQAEGNPQASGHMPSSDRSVTPDGPVSPGQIEGTSDPVTLRRYVRSNPGTGSTFIHPESDHEGVQQLTAELTNQLPEGEPAWLPRKVARDHARIERTEGPDRARRYLATVIADWTSRTLAAERARLQSGETPPGYRPFLPKWAEGGPPVPDHPDQGAAS